MPIYEYECRKCGKVIEAWQKFSDPPITQCDECQGEVRKLISQSTFHLKGTGWYVTDYARKSGGNQAGSPKTEKESSSPEKSGESEASKKADD